jgi:ribosomal-protein-alanine N-acetyltransferase
MSRASDRGQSQIRPIGVFDLDLVAALHAACFTEAWNRESIAAILAMPGAFGLLAEDATAPLGFLLARLAADEAEILSMAVSPSARREGQGSRLLEAGLARMQEGGARHAHLEVAEDNAAAIALYHAFGFRQVGRRKGYYGRSGTEAIGALILSRALEATGRTALGPGSHREA